MYSAALLPTEELHAVLARRSELLQHGDVSINWSHPGSDPDSLASQMVMRRIDIDLGASAVLSVHRGGVPKRLQILAPQLVVHNVAELPPFGTRRSVHSLLDCSDPDYALGPFCPGLEFDFMVDHHGDRLVDGRRGRLIVRKLGSASMITDAVAATLYGRRDYPSPVEAAWLAAGIFTDHGWEHGDARPHHLEQEVWTRAMELKGMADQRLLRDIVDGEWVEGRYASLTGAALETSRRIRIGERLGVCACVSEPLDSLDDDKAYVGKLADDIMRLRPRVRRWIRSSPSLVCTLGRFSRPASVVVSVRTDGSFDASEQVKRITGGRGGGGLRSAGATLTATRDGALGDPDRVREQYEAVVHEVCMQLRATGSVSGRSLRLAGSS